MDRDGAVAPIAALRRLYPWLRHMSAEGGYAGDKLTTALAAHGNWTIEVVKRRPDTKGFEVLPRRWVVELTFAWLWVWLWRRLAADVEATVSSAVPMGADRLHPPAYPPSRKTLKRNTSFPARLETRLCSKIIRQGSRRPIHVIYFQRPLAAPNGRKTVQQLPLNTRNPSFIAGATEWRGTSCGLAFKAR